MTRIHFCIDNCEMALTVLNADVKKVQKAILKSNQM